MVVAVIPARGGSKGIIKKNITDFLGNPLITYTIKQAKDSEEIDEVYVSTDAKDIGAISEEAGAKVIERPDDIAGDKASTESALVHALGQIKQERDKQPEVMVVLQCTSPLRREDDIDEAVRLVTQEGFDSVLSAFEYHKFYWEFDGDAAEPINYNPESRKRRQDINKARYQENGSIYVVKAQMLEKNKCRLGGNIGIHEMPEIMSDEIDTPEDLRKIEAIAEKIAFHGKNYNFRWPGTGI